MAHHIRAYPEPRQQLRTEAPRQRPHNDKYVSVFQSGIAHADITFRDPVLEQSADHYSVGVDELTVSLGSLSMLEYDAVNPGVVLRVRLRGVDGQTDQGQVGGARDWLMPNGPIGAIDQWRDAFEFKVDRTYSNLQEVVSRFYTISKAVSNYINDYGLLNPNVNVGGPYYFPAYELAAGSGREHVQMSMSENGQLTFAGTRAFWANFVIEVPERRYRRIFFASDKQYVSLHPTTGAINEDPYTVVAGHLQTNPFAPPTDPAGHTAITAANQDNLEHVYFGNANIMNSLDRRVTIEVSCSLPIKNSPMVDHGKESPDYAIARYLFHRRYSLETSDAAGAMRFATHDLGVKTLQGARDRVVFHHLRPQQKIQTLRLRLWARVRTYDAVSNKWGMKTIVCPIQNSDFWHCRLHFVHRDS